MSDLTKKLFAGSALVLAFSLYILFLVPDPSLSKILPIGSQSVTVTPATKKPVTVAQAATASKNIASVVPPPQPKTTPTSAPSAPTPTPTPTAKPTPTPAPVVTPAPAKPAGMYKDGTYTGSVADAYYGNVQVQVVVSGGAVANVQFLQYPNDRGTSRMVNGQAMPYLIQEAIQTQNANVNIVSGATDTSMAFQQSLGAALSQAKA